jgi:hypothetical protein
MHAKACGDRSIFSTAKLYGDRSIWLIMSKGVFYGDRSIGRFMGGAMKAAWHEPTNPCFYFDTGPILKSEQIKNPSVKHETRSAVQSLNERLGLGASHSPYWLIVAAGRRERRSGPQRWTESKGRNGKRRNADAVLVFYGDRSIYGAGQ